MFLNILIGFLFISILWGKNVYVFMPGNMNKKTIIQEIEPITSYDVQVFTKFRELHNAIRKDADAIVIAPDIYIDFSQDIKRVFKGVRKHEKGEPYVLVTANNNITLDNLAFKKFGAFDVMGRKNFKQFFPRFFGFSPRSIKRVNKKEDLLTLLGVDMVDAIVLSQSDFKTLQMQTNIPLRVLSRSIKDVGFISVGISGKSTLREAQKLKKIKSSFLQKFSFDRWESE